MWLDSFVETSNSSTTVNLCDSSEYVPKSVKVPLQRETNMYGARGTTYEEELEWCKNVSRSHDSRPRPSRMTVSASYIGKLVIPLRGSRETENDERCRRSFITYLWLDADAGANPF